MQYTDEVVDQ